MKRFLLIGLLAAGCSRHVVGPAVAPKPQTRHAAVVLEGARDQLSWGTVYDAGYYRIPYPEGDVPRDRGACSDVIVRSLRYAGYDLQELIHEDMKRAWRSYPRYAGYSVPDSNIDHRRIPNQRVFFKRHGRACTLSTRDPNAWKPGDIVEWMSSRGHDHTGVISDRLNDRGIPFVIDNDGRGPQEEDVLLWPLWKIVGHFRYPAS